jgi:molybdenum cofactor synthesis domain-containing protein
MAPLLRAAILTVSDSVAQGGREDLSGPAISRLLEGAGWTVLSAEVVPDEFSLLRERLDALASSADVDVVFTTGGTGIGPRDRTPEATTSVMERAIPGLAEVMRREGLKKTPQAALSRAVVGLKANTLLINLPGAPEGAEDSLKAILEILPHAIEVARGRALHEAPAEEAPAESPVETTETEQEPPPEASAPSVEQAPASEPEVEPQPESQDTPEEEGLGKKESV